jgi:hypothetical protein
MRKTKTKTNPSAKQWTLTDCAMRTLYRRVWIRDLRSMIQPVRRSDLMCAMEMRMIQLTTNN